MKQIKSLCKWYDSHYLKIGKFIFKNYFYALLCLLVVFGLIVWFRPARALELIEITSQLSLWQSIWMLLLLNYIWSIGFIIFDCWNLIRCQHDNDEVLTAIDDLYYFACESKNINQCEVLKMVKVIENKLGVRK